MATITPAKYTKKQLFDDLQEDGIRFHGDTITRATNGDADAMANIGIEYDEKEQYDKAMAWYRLAAAKNNPWAPDKIGLLYHYGRGVPEDYSLAMEWFLKAAIREERQAWGHIGELFENGHGVPVNKFKALQWYYKCGNKPNEVEKLKKIVVPLEKNDRYRFIEDLIMETEEIFWNARQKAEEDMALEHLKTKMEQESIVKDKKIKSLENAIETLQDILERKANELMVKQDSKNEYERKYQEANDRMEALKQTNRTAVLELKAKNSSMSALQNENKKRRDQLENSSKYTTKTIKEMERSNQTFQKLLVQEQQLKDGEIEFTEMKTEIETLLEKEKQKRNKLQRKFQAMERELENMKIPIEKRDSIINETFDDSSCNSSDDETDYKNNYGNTGKNNNNINYIILSKPDDIH